MRRRAYGQHDEKCLKLKIMTCMLRSPDHKVTEIDPRDFRKGTSRFWTQLTSMMTVSTSACSERVRERTFRYVGAWARKLGCSSSARARRALSRWNWVGSVFARRCRTAPKRFSR